MTQDANKPSGISTVGNSKAEWDLPQNRRRGLRELHMLHRYGMSLRAPLVKLLATHIDYRISDLKDVSWYKTQPFFNGIVVLQGEKIVYEDYAHDFSDKTIHSIQSITKTTLHLMVAKLVGQGKIDLSKRVDHYIPEIGSGYAAATVQQVLDMDVVNHYSEDYYDPNAVLGELEDAHGWRIINDKPHRSLREFLVTITGDKLNNPSRKLQYKTANTDVVAWVCERCSDTSLREIVLQIFEAAGVADPVIISTDRLGTPFLGGGAHMSLPDLARYGLLLSRYGLSENNNIGNKAFTAATLAEFEQGTNVVEGVHYRNFVESNGQWIGHLGYGGQWLMAYPEHDIVIACLSSIQDDGGLDLDYIDRLRKIGEAIENHL